MRLFLVSAWTTYYIIFIIGHFLWFHHHFRVHAGYSKKMLPARSSCGFLVGWAVRTVFFEMLLKGGLKILLKEGLNEIQISAGGRSYLQIAGSGAFIRHITTHLSFVIVLL